jgi:hypothetical protein
VYVVNGGTAHSGGSDPYSHTSSLFGVTSRRSEPAAICFTGSSYMERWGWRVRSAHLAACQCT